MKNSLTVIGGVVLAIALIVGGVYGYVALYRDVAPRMEDARREVFENTPSYVQGKIQQLTKLRLDYNRAETEAQKATLQEMIVIEAATVDNSELPADLKAFISELNR